MSAQFGRQGRHVVHGGLVELQTVDAGFAQIVDQFPVVAAGVLNHLHAVRMGPAGQTFVQRSEDVVPHGGADQNPVLDAEVFTEHHPVQPRFAVAVDDPFEQGRDPVVQDVDALSLDDEIHEIDLHLAHIATDGKGPARHAADAEAIRVAGPEGAGAFVVRRIVQVGQFQMVEILPIPQYGFMDFTAARQVRETKPGIAPDIGVVFHVALGPPFGGDRMGNSGADEIVDSAAAEVQTDAVFAREGHVGQDDLTRSHGETLCLSGAVDIPLPNTKNVTEK